MKIEDIFHNLYTHKTNEAIYKTTKTMCSIKEYVDSKKECNCAV